MSAVSLLALALGRPASAAAAQVTVTPFESARVELDTDLGDDTQRDNYLVRDNGQTIETTVRLPAAPENQRDAQQIVATVTVAPVLVESEGRPIPSDPWTRLGRLSVLLPAAPNREAVEVELMRFTTGFGGAGTFRQDVTAFAPLLAGTTTLRLSLSTYTKPAWTATLTLTYDSAGIGYRRPVFAEPLFNDVVTANAPVLQARVEVPPGLSMPRVRIISTGHATDGGPEHEFMSCTHILKIDGREIARWRPWANRGGELREQNPWAGRQTIDGRAIWSSDFDRSGWNPGTVVEPLVIPAPELTAGRHLIEIFVRSIRPQAPGTHDHGYWRLSATIVADEPWPVGGTGDRRETPP